MKRWTMRLRAALWLRLTAANCRGILRIPDRSSLGWQEARGTRYSGYSVFHTRGATMTRYRDTTLDTVEYVFGGPLFFIVATATAAVMAVGLVAMTVVDRLIHH
jgi:hypothetical protein